MRIQMICGWMKKKIYDMFRSEKRKRFSRSNKEDLLLLLYLLRSSVIESVYPLSKAYVWVDGVAYIHVRFKAQVAVAVKTPQTIDEDIFEEFLHADTFYKWADLESKSIDREDKIEKILKKS